MAAESMTILEGCGICLLAFLGNLYTPYRLVGPQLLIKSYDLSLLTLCFCEKLEQCQDMYFVRACYKVLKRFNLLKKKEKKFRYE